MIPYAAFFSLLMYFSFYGFTKNSKKFKKIIIPTIILSFLILSSLSYNNGFDWIIYKNFFDSSNNLNLESRFEFGFVFLNYFIHEYISANYNIFIFIYSLIAVYLIYKYCDYFSKNIYFSFLVYGSHNHPSWRLEKNERNGKIKQEG